MLALFLCHCMLICVRMPVLCQEKCLHLSVLISLIFNMFAVMCYTEVYVCFSRSLWQYFHVCLYEQ